MINLVREYEAEYGGFIVACHADVNLDLLKEITGKPVVGIGEALNVPVLDGIVCAMMIAQGLARYDVGTSKARRYNPKCR